MVSRHPGKGRPSSRSRAPSARSLALTGRAPKKFRKGHILGALSTQLTQKSFRRSPCLGRRFTGTRFGETKRSQTLRRARPGINAVITPGGRLKATGFQELSLSARGPRPTLTCPNPQHLARKSICLRFKVERAKGKDRANPGAERRGRFESSSPEQGQVYTRQDQRLQNRILLARLNVYAHV